MQAFIISSQLMPSYKIAGTFYAVYCSNTPYWTFCVSRLCNVEAAKFHFVVTIFCSSHSLLLIAIRR